MPNAVIIPNKMQYLDVPSFEVRASIYHSNGMPALMAIGENGEPLATLSANPRDEISQNTDYPVVAIKDYSENQGAKDTLVSAGVIKDLYFSLQSGYSELHLCSIIQPDLIDQYEEAIVRFEKANS